MMEQEALCLRFQHLVVIRQSSCQSQFNINKKSLTKMSGFISKGKEKFHRLEDKFGHLPGRDRLVESGN